MKPFLMTAGLFFCLAFAQTPVRSQIPQEGEDFECRYFGYDQLKQPREICNFLSFRSNTHAEEVVDKILQQVGLVRNFVVVECPNTENCFATVAEGQRYIVYDGAFMKRVESMTNTDWSAISIVAHEIGHHLQGHTISGRGSRPQKELEADRFSGFVLHQLGASLNESLVAIQTLGDDKPSFSHPAKSVRVEAIRQGWQDAETMNPKNGQAAQNEHQPSNNTAQLSKKAPVVQAAPVPETNENDDSIGCLSGNCDNGWGTYVHEETHERYEGDFRFGKRHGAGVQYYANGNMKYKGEFRNDARAGYGAYYFNSGDKFVGQFAENAPNGKGTYYYADGDRFVGLYENGKRNGSGIYYHRDGRRKPGLYEEDELVR